MTGIIIARLKAFVSRLREFPRESGGNFAVTTALVLVPLLAVSGMTIDVSQALARRQEMIVAGDAATLDAVSESALRDFIAAGSYSNAALLPPRAAKMEKVFLAEISRKTTAIVSPQVSGTMTIANGRIVAKLNYSGTLKTTFMWLLGYKELKFGYSSTGSANLPHFQDMHILVDNSPSTTITANESERTRLKKAVIDWGRANKMSVPAGGCEFACHVASTNPADLASNFYQIALNSGILLRLDVIKDTISSAMKDYAYQVYDTDLALRLTFSVYDFGDDMRTLASKPLVNLVSGTTDPFEVVDAVNRIIPMATPYNGYGDAKGTPMPQALDRLITTIGVAGDGMSPAKAEKSLVIVTDGVSDLYKPAANCIGIYNYSGSRCIESLDPAQCDKLKKNGVRVAVLLTGYPVVETNDFYMAYIAPQTAKISKNAKACASPGLFVEVNLGADIQGPMNELLGKLRYDARLTN